MAESETDELEAVVDELNALNAIYEGGSGEESFHFELVKDSTDAVAIGELRVAMEVPVGGLQVKHDNDTWSIRHLPPIHLHFRLSKGYPSTKSPLLSLQCLFLSRNQLSSLLSEIKMICEDALSTGSVVLFSVAEFLQHSWLASVGIEPVLDLDFPPLRASAVAQALRRYDANQQQQIFNTSVFQCGICIENKMGAVCASLPSCGHTFCKECLAGYFEAYLKDKNVIQVSCPNSQCKKVDNSGNAFAPLPKAFLEQIISPTLVGLHEDLVKMHFLLQQPNLTYCPRVTCNAATVKDPEEEKLCICLACGFSFCYFCNKSWHGYASYCRTNHLEAIAKEYSVSNEAERRELEIKYGKKILERSLRELEDEEQSKEWLQSNTQKCPVCSVCVERTEGCCHMTCITCSTHFCFRCGDVLDKRNPYTHYNTKQSPCYGKLFEGALDNDGGFMMGDWMEEEED